MKIQPLESVFLSDSDISRFQDNVNNFINQLTSNEFLKGNLIKDVALNTTAIKLEHKLSVAPIGYLVVGQNASASIYSTAKDENFLTLQASASVTVNIWVF